MSRKTRDFSVKTLLILAGSFTSLLPELMAQRRQRLSGGNL